MWLSRPGLLLPGLALLIAAAETEARIQPVPLEDVELTPGSPFWKSLTLNTEYMLALEPDRLLWTFRNNAKLPTPNQPFAQTWEDPNCEVRGQFIGHYLSACATLARQTGEACNCDLSPSLQLLPIQIRSSFAGDPPTLIAYGSPSPP